jgi:hypothetical protein
MAESLLSRGLVRVFRFVNRFTTWDKLPLPLSLANLDALRIELRRDNLHDTSAEDLKTDLLEGTGNPRHRIARMPDGSYNDLEDPHMGSLGMRFGRNFPLSRSFPERGEKLMEPNPRDVSRALLTRDAFKPATTLNVLAAAWIQFMVHGWVFHNEDPDDSHAFDVPLRQDDPWPQRPMKIRRTPPDPTRVETSEDPPSFINHVTHWWDASQMYGSSRAELDALRSGADGKLKLENGRLPLDPVWGVDLTGFNRNYWVGLSVLHTLFALEHNAICDRLRREYPSWSDQQLFDTARLVNGALLAKIHTVEWTPAILGHPALQIAMHANWWGLATERITRALGRFGEGELISGIPGSPADHHGAFFSMTEEFTAVYRLHSLIPDDYAFHSASDGRWLRDETLAGVSDRAGRALLDGDALSFEDVAYSLGIANPGALTLHNYPRGLQDLTKADGVRVDLATVDILRDRERGVPRYNDFRELLRKPRLERFEELTGDPRWVSELKQVYGGDIDRVDTLVGLMAETPPAGFGFSDTAFRIFILMASRRLKSDRFFCEDYTPAVYTQEGLDWIAENDMTSVLLRHWPSLAPALHGVRNAFAPWKRLAQDEDE